MADHLVIALLAWGWSAETPNRVQAWALRIMGVVATLGVLEDLIIAAPHFLAEHYHG